MKYQPEKNLHAEEGKIFCVLKTFFIFLIKVEASCAVTKEEKEEYEIDNNFIGQMVR